MILKRYSLLLLACLPLLGLAQEYKLYVQNASATKVSLKWFSKKASPDAAYNIYRKTSASAKWEKVNQSPIVAAKPLNQNEIKALGKKLEQDPQLGVYSVARNKMTADPGNAQLLYGALLFQALDANRLAELLGIYTEDATVVSGTSYTYKLVLVQNGAEKELAQSAEIKTGVVKITESPLLFKATAGNKLVNLSWTHNASFPMYKVIRKETIGSKKDTAFYFIPSQEQVSKSGTLTFQDEDVALTIGKTYQYQLFGIDVFGNNTKPSAAISVTMTDLESPFAITGFAAKLYQDNAALLKWQRSSAKDVAGYFIYRSTNENSGFELLTKTPLPATDTSWTDKTVKEGVRYHYYIDVQDKSGNKTSSGKVTFQLSDKTPPAIPTGLSGLADTNQIKLSWLPNKEADLQGYYIFRALNNDLENFNLLNKNPWAETTFIDTLPAEASNAFVYKICAVDMAFNRSQTTTVVSIKKPDITPPTAPFIYSVESPDETVTITFNISRADADIKQIDLWRYTRDSVSNGWDSALVKSVSSANGIQPLKDTPPFPATFGYRMVSTDSSGNKSRFSNLKLVFAGEHVKPVAPISFDLKLNAASKQVDLSWAGRGFFQYAVYRKAPDQTSFLPVSTVGTIPNFTDSELQPGRYSYLIRTYAPNGEFTDSNSKEIEVQ